MPSGPSSSSSRASRSGDASCVSRSLRPFVRWLMASTWAKRSHDRRPALKQYPIALSMIPASMKCSREQFRLRLHQVRKPRFQHRGDLLMKSPALRPVDRTVQRFLEQRMLKEVHWPSARKVSSRSRAGVSPVPGQRSFGGRNSSLANSARNSGLHRSYSSRCCANRSKQGIGEGSCPTPRKRCRSR